MLLVACSSPRAAPAQSANPAETWSMYRGDLARDGHPPTATLSEQSAARLAIAWRADLIGAVDGTPAVAGGMVIAGSASGTTWGSASPPTGMFALGPSDGAVTWRRESDQPVYSAPAVGNGVVVFGSGAVFGDLHSGSILALSTADGHALWSYDTHSAVRSGPALAGDLVVAGDHAGELIAFRPAG